MDSGSWCLEGNNGGENEWEQKDAHQDKLSLAVVAGRRLEGTKEFC